MQKQDTPWQPSSFRYLTASDLDGDFAPHTRIICIFDAVGSLRSQHGKRDLPQYFIEGNHEAIVSREMFSEAQNEIAARAAMQPHGDGIRREYPFSGKIICGGCGKGYRRRHNNGKLTWQCGTYMVRGKKHCAAKQIHEKILCDISASVLGTEEFDEGLFKTQIRQITIYNDNRLVFSFYDGREVERTWQDPSRRDSWTPEMKQKAAAHAKRRYANE